MLRARLGVPLPREIDIHPHTSQRHRHSCSPPPLPWPQAFLEKASKRASPAMSTKPGEVSEYIHNFTAEKRARLDVHEQVRHFGPSARARLPVCPSVRPFVGRCVRLFVTRSSGAVF